MHGEAIKTSWGWAYEVRPLHTAFTAFAVGCALVGMAAGRRAFAAATEGERSQALFVCGGILVPLVVVTATDALLPLMGFESSPGGGSVFRVRLPIHTDGMDPRQPVWPGDEPGIDG